MEPRTKVKNQATVNIKERYTTSFVTSKDDATIGYRQLGHGPGVVLLYSGFSSAHNHMQLAEALAAGGNLRIDTETVPLADVESAWQRKDLPGRRLVFIP